MVIKRVRLTFAEPRLSLRYTARSGTLLSSLVTNC